MAETSDILIPFKVILLIFNGSKLVRQGRSLGEVSPKGVMGEPIDGGANDCWKKVLPFSPRSMF